MTVTGKVQKYKMREQAIANLGLERPRRSRRRNRVGEGSNDQVGDLPGWETLPGGLTSSTLAWDNIATPSGDALANAGEGFPTWHVVKLAVKPSPTRSRLDNRYASLAMKGIDPR